MRPPFLQDHHSRAFALRETDHMDSSRAEYELHTVRGFWHLRVATLMSCTRIHVAHNIVLIRLINCLMIRLIGSMTATRNHHVLMYEVNIVTRFGHLCVAILITVTRIRVAHKFDWITITSCSMIQLTVAMTVKGID